MSIPRRSALTTAQGLRYSLFMKRSMEGAAGGQLPRPTRRPKPATMKEVAARAGVALGTVSRVINGHPDVDPRLRERVEGAIQELGYRPNARARSFNRDASPLISYILGNRDILNPFHSRILQGVEEYCDGAGYFVLFTKFRYTPDIKPSELRLPPVLQSHGLSDCVILAGTNYGNFLEALEALGVPYVLLANNLITKRKREAFDQVRFDDATGAYEATAYLISLGHQHIWYIGDISLPWVKVKYESYVCAMSDHGLQPLAQTIGLANDYFTNAYRSVKLIRERKRPLTAILSNDDGALGAWDALSEAGLQVPGDVSLIGFGDNEYVQVKVPPLTTVRIDRLEIGRQLANMAVSKIKDPAKQWPEVVVPTTLIRRGTTRPLLPDQRTHPESEERAGVPALAPA